MSIAPPLSDNTFLLVIKDVMKKMTRTEYEHLLVSIGQYSLIDFRDMGDYVGLSKHDLIVKSFEEGDARELLSELHQRRELASGTVSAMIKDGFEFDEEDETSENNNPGEDKHQVPADASGFLARRGKEQKPYIISDSMNSSDQERIQCKPKIVIWFNNLNDTHKTTLAVAVIGSIIGGFFYFISTIAGTFFEEVFEKSFSKGSETTTPVTIIGEIDYTAAPSNLFATGTPSPLIPETLSPSTQPSSTSTAFEKPTIYPSITETPIELCELIFEENFDSNERGWHVGDSIDYLYTNEERAVVYGVYRMSALFQENALTTSTIPTVDLKDFSLTFDVAITSKAGDGPADIVVSFRIDDSGNYYAAKFGDDGYYSLLTWDEDHFETVIDRKESDAFNLSIGVTNTFLINADGWRISMYANGTEIDGVINSSINSIGRIGIGLSGAKGMSVVGTFDNVQVCNLYETITPIP